jgi:type IV pilus assembly protein PilB
MSLLQTLVKKGILEKGKASELEYEIRKSGKREEEVILEKGIVPEQVLFNVKSENLGMPLREIPVEDIPLKVLEVIPEEAARYYKIIPLSQKENILEVGMVYPEDLKAQEALKFLSRQGNLLPKISLINFSIFESLLKQYRTLREEVKKALGELEGELKKEEKIEVKPQKATEFDRLVEEAPISKVVAVMLRHAVEGKASDIHIEPIKKTLRVRFRVDGTLHSSILLPLKILPAVVARIKILSNLRLDETRIPQDGRFTSVINNKETDFRVSTFPTALGEKVALRVLDSSGGVMTLEGLGLEERDHRVILDGIKKPYGLILATGPTGSGKTTTLYAILNLLNKEGVNIVTLEDPVEYFIDGVNQSQVKPEIGYSFATGLREVVRQDPDVIMVGEIRDEETASLAIHSALTGHIVLSTLHTNNAVGVIPRLIDMKISPFLLPPTLSLAIAQRLIRILCPECKKKIKPSKEIQSLILKEIESLPEAARKEAKLTEPFFIYEAQGCKKCQGQGYKGRTALYEILEMTKGLEKMVLTESSEAKIAEEARKQGMVTMKQDGILKVLKGITTVEEVLRVAEEK